MSSSTQSIVARGVCLGALLALSSSCTVPRSGSQNSYTGTSGKLELERIEGNRQLAASLEIQNPLEKTVDGRKVAQFTLKNTRSNKLEFAWAVDWFDEDGFRISDNTRTFQPVALGGYGTETITIYAPRAGEKLSWKLTVTSPDEVH